MYKDIVSRNFTCDLCGCKKSIALDTEQGDDMLPDGWHHGASSNTHLCDNCYKYVRHLIAFATLHQFCCSHEDCANCELNIVAVGCALKHQPTAWGQCISILEDSNHPKEAEAVSSLLGFCSHSKDCNECPYGLNHYCLFKGTEPERWVMD